jgi:hypothetical protein
VTSAEPGHPGGGMEPSIGLGRGSSRPMTHSRDSDPVVAALVHYVEALHRRYPEGPEQLRREGLDGRANITGMSDRRKGTAS